MATVVDLVQAVFVVASVLYAGRQVGALRQQVRGESLARRLEATRSYLDHVSAEDVRSARHWLLGLRAVEYRPHHLTLEDRARVLRLAVVYDRVGLMVAFDLLDENMVFSWQGREIVQIWHRAFPVIATERAVLGREDYCRYFEGLAARLDLRLRTPPPSDG